MGSKMLLSLPERDRERIEELVRAGEYSSKSELIRFAIKEFLYSEERMGKLRAATSKLQARGRSRRRIERDIREAKAETARSLSK